MNDLNRTGLYHPATVEEVATAIPQHIGRYRVERVLGEGGFGLVYLAHDGKLQRLVAIKVPHRNRVSTAEDAEAYLTEARTVANLDHPNIVPVHDVGSTEDCPCFIVSKFIEGSTLAQRIKDNRPSCYKAAELVAMIAEALHYAHRKGLIHRDIKPSNILIDTSGNPFVVDFGLALKEENIGHGPKYAGTPAYMSPEQARGEGHRVDGRSDIFSLGVVCYELLVGRQPFRAESQAELMEHVTSFEARPPRQYDDSIPKELERICLKALSKRASERYTTAKDMADDLRHFLAEQTINQQPNSMTTGIGLPSITPVVQPPSTLGGVGTSVTPRTPTSVSQPIKLVPKGLRSFDAHDADFFLELLPGPRDREGLPASIQFWKTRIEETDAEKTFSVGLICGPSGCGKSSLVKAGLLPRLSDDVIAVYVEATAEETESRLLNGLRKRFPALSDNLSLKETLAALRRGQGIPTGKKVLIVLDQFEQWLHAKKEEQNTELVQALRQCDGGRVQCLVMVRDDFWMAVIRFMRELEIRLLEGQNSAAVDLFPIRHAEKVLAAFGRAFGALPDSASETSKEQKDFLNQAVSGLAQEGKVISVRLALFAEMMKSKAWTPGSLKAVGGTEGVGVTFLEETFSAATAPPAHRYHQKAARGVLNGLLPESGTDIKGHMRSYGELLGASGYGSRPKDFDDLIRILDGEIRLITPTDPEGVDSEHASSTKVEAGQKYYQLAHDYLVPSLRDWLTRKQKETRRGRAELLLADRAGVWNTRPENRQLPSLLQWLSILGVTQKRNWTGPQNKMMRKASRYYAVRGLVVAVLIAVVTLTGLTIREQVVEQHKATEAAGLVQRLLDADTAQVPAIIGEMSEYRRWVDPLLREENDKATVNSRQKLHTSLALLSVDAMQVDYLFGRLLGAAPNEVPVIRDALAPHKDALLDKLWKVAESPAKGKEHQRLRAASALAKYDPEGQSWAKVGGPVVDQLVAENPVFLGLWMEGFRPINRKLLASLASIHRNTRGRESERTLATNILADYAADQPQVLADLLMDADEKQFAVIYPKFKEQGERGLSVLTGEIDRKLPPDATDEVTEKLAKRQANAAVALLKMDQPEKVWPLLKHSPDPRVRSHLIHRLSPLGAEAEAIIRRVDEEPDVTIRRALILSLGEYGEKELSPEARKAVLPKLQYIYRTATDPGLHGSAEWLLRQWKQDGWLKQINEEWAKDKEQREKRLDSIKQLVTNDKEKTPPQWYVNGQGQTMVVIPGPVQFVMGSPPTEAGRQDVEIQHKKRIGRTFAIAAKAVTVEQYRQFDKGYSLPAKYTRTAELPLVGTSWYQAAAYCNWLSKEEGIREDQWCYEIKGQVTKLRANYLSLAGYRLPTEAEMEYATRAGVVTSRYFGEADELLPKYAWYQKNSQEQTWPVGSLKPNDFGLFDVQGNVFSWCQESYKAYSTGNAGELTEDQEDELAVASTVNRALRGGSFEVQPSHVRSADRNFKAVPTNRYNSDGFRLARTFAH
ncbi:MAG TPA: SUMF1/EgtB/PvdO family nonheme iron enzyme [Gemmataceae bacterium]|nr:SUMF1/EgtB/PvdO family nonheme iron enzyme [Gemmataceae bacterium]